MKRAYPQIEYINLAKTPYDIPKWISSLHSIYANSVTLGWDLAFDLITKNWDDMEKKDFNRWISFYQQDSHNKYKTAQFAPNNYLSNGGSFIPNMDHLKGKLPSPIRESEPLPVLPVPGNNKQLQQDLVEKKIQSLIGRLNSAEKIATNPQVQIVLKKSLKMSVDEWVSLLQQLKREIQLAPIRWTTSSLSEDLIYKHANKAYSQGFKKEASLLLRIAQQEPPASTIPTPPQVEMSVVPPAGTSTPSETSENSIIEFLNNLNNEDLDYDYNSVDDEADDNDQIIVEAQEVSPAPPSPPPAPPAAMSLSEPAPSSSIEVSEDDLTTPSKESSGDPFDRALSDVKVQDIVARLEGIASMFKNRQIARELSIIDLMMDKVGIAPFFPSLAEAMRSALDSNQYCQSRIEEILAKLRGIISTPMSEHLENKFETDSTAKEQEVKKELEKQEQEEKIRKEKKKMLREQEELGESDVTTPPASTVPNSAPVAQALSGPANVQSAPPLRPRV